MGRNSPSDLKAAVQALTRISAVESSYDKEGRAVWHKGEGDAELVSWVDQRGRLLKQLFVLFVDVVFWQHGQRVRTGALKKRSDLLSMPGPGDVLFDGTPDRERLGRAKLAIEGYDGADKYVKHLTRVVDLSSSFAVAGAAVVTRGSHDELQRRHQALLRKEAVKKGLLVGLGALAVLALAMLLFRH